MEISRDYEREIADTRMRAAERLVIKAINRRLITKEGGAELLVEIWGLK